MDFAVSTFVVDVSSSTSHIPKVNVLRVKNVQAAVVAVVMAAAAAAAVTPAAVVALVAVVAAAVTAQLLLPLHNVAPSMTVDVVAHTMAKVPLVPVVVQVPADVATRTGMRVAAPTTIGTTDRRPSVN